MHRRRAILALILSIGVAAAAVAWLTAPAPDDNAEVEELHTSKRHLRDLERIAGKSGVLANDLDDWLASLWEGRNRAVTILVGAAGAAGLYALVTRNDSR